MPPHATLLTAPPAWAQRFRTDDLDELYGFVAAAVGHHSRVVRGTGRLGFDQASLGGTATALRWVHTDLGTVVRGAVRQPVFHLAMPAGSIYRSGRRRHEATARTLSFVAPDWEYTLERPPGMASAVGIDGKALAAELDARQPGSRGEPMLRTRAIEIDEAAQAELPRALDEVVCTLDPAAAHPCGAHAEARLIAALAGLLIEGGAAVRAQPIAAARLADLEAWIDANLSAPISIGRLCAVAGVGERALQKSFEARRGMSPMRFVTERRLAAARRELAEAGWRDDVTSIALRLGFDHPGRFAALYRQAFGETPSQSLRRSRG